MILNKATVNEIKEKSGLLLEQAKDYTLLASQIMERTGRGIGITTLKRLLGHVNDDRRTNKYTLNTLAIFLGYSTWEEYSNVCNIDSEWSYTDKAVYVKDLEEGTHLRVKYLNRTIEFVVVNLEQSKVLKVETVLNSSLRKGDLLYIYSLKVGAILEAQKVVRNDSVGNYKTHGEITSIEFL